MVAPGRPPHNCMGGSWGALLGLPALQRPAILPACSLRLCAAARAALHLVRPTHDDQGSVRYLSGNNNPKLYRHQRPVVLAEPTAPRSSLSAPGARSSLSGAFGAAWVALGPYKGPFAALTGRIWWHSSGPPPGSDGRPPLLDGGRRGPPRQGQAPAGVLRSLASAVLSCGRQSRAVGSDVQTYVHIV